MKNSSAAIIDKALSNDPCHAVKGDVLKWIPVKSLIPNPKNPRIGNPDKLAAITESMRVNGFRQEKPLLVRSIEGSKGMFQIIGGHTRWQAAQNAELESVLCVVEQMTDEQAILRLAEDNLADPFPWYSLALYVAQNAEKGDKNGLSRTDLIRACMGKDGAAAKSLATRYGAVGELLIHLGVGSELHDATVDSEALDRLLNPEFNRVGHLYEISKADHQDWEMLIVSMLDESWTVEQCKGAVEAVKQVCTIPEWLHPVFDPATYKADCIGNERLISDLKNWVETAQEHYESLPPKREVKRVDGDEYRVEYWNLQELFIDALQEIQNPSVKRINDAAQTVLLSVSALDDQFATWEKARESEAAKQAAQEEAKRTDLERIAKYSPVGICGDARDVLPAIEKQSIDLILTAPPGDGITPDEWIKPIVPLLKSGGMMIVVCSHWQDWEIRRMADFTGLELLEFLVWERPDVKDFSHDVHSLSHELIMVFYNPGKEYESKVNGYVNSSVFHHDDELDLFGYLMHTYSDEDAAVLDPFGGDGTTAIAAKRTGRCCTWIEIDSKRFEEGVSRVEQIKFPWEL